MEITYQDYREIRGVVKVYIEDIRKTGFHKMEPEIYKETVKSLDHCLAALRELRRKK